MRPDRDRLCGIEGCCSSACMIAADGREGYSMVYTQYGQVVNAKSLGIKEWAGTQGILAQTMLFLCPVIGWFGGIPSVWHVITTLQVRRHCK